MEIVKTRSGNIRPRIFNRAHNNCHNQPSSPQPPIAHAPCRSLVIHEVMLCTTRAVNRLYDQSQDYPARNRNNVEVWTSPRHSKRQLKSGAVDSC